MVQFFTKTSSVACVLAAIASTSSAFVTPSTTSSNQITAPAFVPKVQSSTALEAAPTMVIY